MRELAQARSVEAHLSSRQPSNSGTPDRGNAGPPREGRGEAVAVRGRTVVGQPVPLGVDVVGVDEEEEAPVAVALEPGFDPGPDRCQPPSPLVKDLEALEESELAPHPAAVGEGGGGEAGVPERSSARVTRPGGRLLPLRGVTPWVAGNSEVSIDKWDGRVPPPVTTKSSNSRPSAASASRRGLVSR